MTVHSSHGCRKLAVTVCITIPRTALHKTTRLGLAQNGNTLYNESKNAVKIGVLAQKQRKAKR